MTVLNLGCGMRRLTWENKKFPEGTIHIDRCADAKPDRIWNLDCGLPPEFVNNVDEIHAYHIVEHIGKMGETDMWFAFWAACWNALKPYGKMFVVCPHYLDESAMGDPGHTRLISPQSFIFLDRRTYARNHAQGTAMSPYGIQFDLPQVNGFNIIESERAIPRAIYAELQARKTLDGGLVPVEESKMEAATA